jgi:hypothetical protein
MKPFQRKQLCCVTQNAIACLDSAGLLRRSHMTLQQNTEYLVCVYSSHIDSGVQMGERQSVPREWRRELNSVSGFVSASSDSTAETWDELASWFEL